jgi:hypothetical protein
VRLFRYYRTVSAATLQIASDSFHRIQLTGISPSRPVRRV